MRRDLLVAAMVALVALASLPAYERVLVGTAWRAPALLAALGGIVVALLARWARIPTLLSLPVSAAVLLAVLPTALDVGEGWRAGVAAQWDALAELARTGGVVVAEEIAPVAADPGLVLLLVAGWWLVAGFAAEVVLRVRLLGPALVLLVALWTVPLAIPSPATPSWTQVVPWLVAAGALALTHVQTASPGPVTVPVSGLLLLAVAVAAGSAAPWVLPGYEEEAWASFGDGDAPRGYQPIVDVSTRLRSPQEREVLLVRASQPTYLRLAGLDSFDGTTWRLGPGDGGTFRPDPDRLFPADQPLPPEEPASRTRAVEADIEVLSLENLYVPLPYQPVEVLGPIRDDMVWSTQGGFLAAYEPGDLLRDPRVGLTPGASYRVLAEQPAPTIEELRGVTVPAQLLAAATALPRPYPELGQLARQIYDDAGAVTTVDRALALQDWFIGPDGGFTYDLDVPALRGEEALTRFVLEDRVGYCEYFATAMAVMLRATGIPARVAVGFLPGERLPGPGGGGDAQLDTYRVTTADAHAWVEVLFPGYGWVTFEPTPRSDGAQFVPRVDELLPLRSEAERAEGAATPAPEEPEAPEVPTDTEPALPETLEETDAGEQDADGAGTTSSPLRQGVLLVMLVLLVAVALVVARTERRRRSEAPPPDPRAAVLAAQRRLYRTARRLGVPRRPEETTIEVLRRWERQRDVPAGTSAVGSTVQEAAFGATVESERAARAVATLDAAREHLTGTISRSYALRQRFRAGLGRVPLVWRRTTTWWRSR